MRFYGMSFNDVFNLELINLKELHKAMIKIKAQETIDSLEISSFPNLNTRDRKKIKRRLSKDLKHGENEVYDSPKDIARMLNNGR